MLQEDLKKFYGATARRLW